MYLSKNSIIMGSNKVMLAPVAVAVRGCVRSWPLEVVASVQMVLIIVMLMLTTTVSTTLRRCTMSA